MKVKKTLKFIHFQKIDHPLKLSPGLKKILGTKLGHMSRMEIMIRLTEKLHFFKLHNVLSEKNYRVPKSWKLTLKTQLSYVDELDLLSIISQNTV